MTVHDSRDQIPSLGDIGSGGVGGILGKLFSGMQEAVFIQDSDRPPRIRFCNPAAEKIFGYSKEEMVGRTAEFLHSSPEAAKDLRAQVYAAAEQDDSFHNPDYTMKRADGELFPVELTVYEITGDDGFRQGWAIIVKDDSQRRLVEDEIRQSEKKFKAIFESQAAGVVIIDAKKKKILNVNERYAEFLGYEVEEMIGLSIPDVNVQEEIEDAVNDLEALFRGEKSEYLANRWVKKKDGTRILVEVHGALVTDESGRPDFTISIVHDLTDRAKAEQEKEMKLKLQGVLEMAGAAAHEFNQPLQILMGQVDLLSLGVHDQVRTSQKLEIIEAELERLARIISKIQGITRYETQDYAGTGRIVDIHRSGSEKN